MSIIQKALDTLVDGEAAMKRLIAEAAENGDYSLVEKLAKWAGCLGAMYAEVQSAAQSDQKPTVQPRRETVTPPTVVAARHKAPSKTHGHSKRRAYPVFAKSGDFLVKIAWSKSSKSEYQHKSPRFVAMVLAESLIRQINENTIVSMDKILPLKANDGSDIPDYQVYVSLAWLRKVGIVKQNGRQGYTVKKVNDLQQAIESAWSNLPETTFG